MAGWVSPGTIPPVSAYLKSFAWLIRDDRTAAPNLHSAVTRGHGERRGGRVHTLYPGPDARQLREAEFGGARSALHVKLDFIPANGEQGVGRQEMMWC